MKIKVLVIFTLLAVLSVGFSVESLAADKAKAERVDKNAKVCNAWQFQAVILKSASVNHNATGTNYNKILKNWPKI